MEVFLVHNQKKSCHHDHIILIWFIIKRKAAMMIAFFSFWKVPQIHLSECGLIKHSKVNKRRKTRRALRNMNQLRDRKIELITGSISNKDSGLLQNADGEWFFCSLQENLIFGDFKYLRNWELTNTKTTEENISFFIHMEKYIGKFQ